MGLKKSDTSTQGIPKRVSDSKEVEERKYQGRRRDRERERGKIKRDALKFDKYILCAGGRGDERARK